MANTSGGIALSRNYEPYGTIYSAMGISNTAYGFTSEWADGTGLVNLRARYYAPIQGRFISQDRWRGNINNPLTLNKWLYANGNPIKFTDPSGMISYDESKDAEIIINTLLQYAVTVVQDWGLIPTPVPTPGHSEKGCNNWDSGRWSLMDLKILDYSIFQLSNQLKGVEGFKKSIGSVKISKQFYTCGRGFTYNLGFYRKIELLDTGRPAKDAPLEHYIRNASFDFDAWTVVHELGHAWDFNYSKKLSIGIESFTSGHTDKSNNYPTGCKSYEPGCNDAGYYYGGIPPKGSDAGFTREEDFAESVAAYVFPNQAQQAVSNYRGKVSERYLYYEDFTKTLRYSYINGLIYK